MPHNNLMHFKITFKIGSIIFKNLSKGNIFAVFRNVTDNVFFSSNIFLSVFSYLFIAFHIEIIIDYFFHIISVFRCIGIDVVEIIINTICDNTKFRLWLISLFLFVLVLYFLWLINCSSYFLSWSEGLSFKSSNYLTPCCVEWKPELISKACWKNWLVL